MQYCRLGRGSAQRQSCSLSLLDHLSPLSQSLNGKRRVTLLKRWDGR
jgi:hypothetical protein